MIEAPHQDGGRRRPPAPGRRDRPFADLVGFTSSVPGAHPDGLARCRRFFTEAVEAPCSPTAAPLDKFIGDAVMAFFGAGPGPRPR